MLDATPKKLAERTSGSMINPAKTCQPIGAMYAALGFIAACRTATVHRVAVPITGCI